MRYWDRGRVSERTVRTIKSRKRAARESTAAFGLTGAPSVELVYVLPIRRRHRPLGDVGEAISFIDSFDESEPDVPIVRYEVGVRYSNGNEIRGQFMDKAAAIAFLRGLR